MAARGKADEPVSQAFLKNNVRNIEIGNNLYPTPWRAERYGMAEDELAQAFWNGVNLDYTRAADPRRTGQGRAGRRQGSPHHQPQRHRPEGAGQGRPVLVSDGIISDADRKAGGAALAAYLPAGEVYTTPVPGTAEGKIVHTRDFFRGKQIDNLTLTLAGGKVTGMTGAGAGFADFKAAYDAVDDRARTCSAFFDLGINPNVKLPSGSRVGTWVRRARSPSAPAATRGPAATFGSLRQHHLPPGQHRDARWQGDRRERRAEALIGSHTQKRTPLLAGGVQVKHEAGGIQPLTHTTWRKVCTTSTRSACAAITASIDL